MISSLRFLFIVAITLFVLNHIALSEDEESSTSAIVTKIKGTATAQETSSSPKAILKKDQQIAQKGTLSTQSKSLLEVEFENKSMIRLGANSLFSFDRSTREYEVNKGKFLLQVYGDDEDSKVRTSSFTAGITGTTIVTETDESGRNSKIYVLETEDENGVEVTSNKTGEKVYLKPGESLALVADTLQKLNIISFDVQQFWNLNELKNLGNLHNNVEQAFSSIEEARSNIENARSLIENPESGVENTLQNLPGLLPFGR